MPVMKSIENLPLSELKQILTPEEIMELTGATLIKGKDGDSIKGDPGKSIKGDKGDPGKSIKGDPGKSIKGNKGDRGLRGLKGKAGKDAKPVDMVKLVKAAEDVASTAIKSFNPIVDVNIEQDSEGAKLLLTKSDGEVVENRFQLRVSSSNGRYTRTKINELEKEIESIQVSEDSILYMASIAPSTATYTGELITLLTYDSFSGITNHTKTLGYDTSDQLTTTQEIFDYNSQTWTIDISLTYVNGIWQTKSINIAKV